MSARDDKARRLARVLLALDAAEEVLKSRAEEVLELLGPEVYCLGKTQGGHPRHPLYLPSTAALVPYRA